MLNKPMESFMQLMAVCLPWLKGTDATYNYMPCCENILGVVACWLISVWIFFMWYQKFKISCLVVFRDEGTFGPTTVMLFRGSKTNPLTWDIICSYPSTQCFLRLSLNTIIFELLSFSWWKDTQKLNMFWDLISNGLHV